MFSLKCVCVCTRWKEYWPWSWTLTTDIFSPEKCHSLQWKPCEKGGIISSPGGHVLTLDVQIVFPWKAGLWEQRLASTKHLWIFHSDPQEAPIQEQIWLCLCNAVLAKTVKNQGKTFIWFQEALGQAYFACLFFFSKTFLLGSNTRRLCLMSFPQSEMETRPISNGVGVRRVLRVSILIKKRRLFCSYFEAVVNLQMFREVTWYVEPNAGHRFHAAGGWADLPQVLVHCWQWTPYSWCSYRGVDNLLLMFSTVFSRLCSYLGV